MNISDKRTGIVVLISVLWVVITILGWTNRFMTAMFLGVVLMFLHMLLGSANKGKVKPAFLFYPLGIWAALWVLSFALSWYFSNTFAGTVPDFTILGFHPSFAWTILTYWLGGVATLTIGFVMYKDHWLSKQDWDEFLARIEELNKEAAK